ncbi:phosphoribosylformylglycinamidine synthase [Clostridiales bacterium PH28_bin88]|nr:phosphoribosylformylglycinamidine synthase [Clostridiales bacterium PH28_bin88]
MFLAKIHVTLKPGVLDPQGSAVEKALHALEYNNVRDVRIGKYMEVRLEGADRVRVEEEVHEMCRRLLSNPVIENYEFQLVEVAS